MQAVCERKEGTFKRFLSERKQWALAKTYTDPRHDVHVTVDPNCTYGVELKRGDSRLIPNSECHLTSKKFQLMKCHNLTSDEMTFYLDGLVENNITNHYKLSVNPLRRINKCPGPWEYIVSQEKLDIEIVRRVLEVISAVSKNPVRKHQLSFSGFFKSISVRPFFKRAILIALKAALETLQRLGNNPNYSESQRLAGTSLDLCLAVKKWCPSLMSSLLPLVKLHVDYDSPICDNWFLFQLLEGSASSLNHDSLNILTSTEIKNSDNARVQLPEVHVGSPYCSVDAYLHTYTSLYREDRFSKLRNTLCCLSKGITDRQKLETHVLPDIRIYGLQVLHTYPGLGVIVGVER
jgi:hypothetical protein